MMDLKDFSNFKGAIKDTIWYSFVVGDTYSSPSSFWEYCWGYLLILILLIFERTAQAWTYNRYGVDSNTSLRVERITR